MSRVVDLSYPVTNGMPVYPGDAEVEVVRMVELREAGYNLTRLSMSAHAGTHTDAPFHFVPDGAAIERLSLDVMIGRAEVIDLGDLAPDSAITAEMLQPFVDRVVQGARVLLRTGWGRRFGRPEFFTGQPDLTQDAAEWLVDRGIALLGVEQPSLSSAENRLIHKLILGAGIVVIENLANLEAVSSHATYLVALPLNLVGCDGAPTRVVALEVDPK